MVCFRPIIGGTLAPMATDTTREQLSNLTQEQLTDPDRLLDAGEVAALIGHPLDYVWKLAREKRIPRIKLGQGYRFRRKAILDWLEDLEEGG